MAFHDFSLFAHSVPQTMEHYKFSIKVNFHRIEANCTTGHSVLVFFFRLHLHWRNLQQYCRPKNGSDSSCTCL